jgi:xylose isomerase
MIKKPLIVLFVILSNYMFGQQKKFQINGAARGYFFSNELNIDESLDTITTRKANYGHTLLDMGVNLFPNNNTEVLAMFRIRNELGGFWGGGVSFDVRQLSLKGVAADVVRYELGDVDLKMTPYTLFNYQ